MNRRDFLNIPNESSTSAQTERVKRDIPIVSTRSAGYPREYARHAWVFIEKAHAWLGRDSLGFYAIDATCTHLGGLVRFDENAFVCPCHSSIFTIEGTVTTGPARHSLRFLRVALDSDGKLIIQRDQLVSPDERFIA